MSSGLPGRRAVLRMGVALAAAFASAACGRRRTSRVAGFSQMANVGAWRIAETNSMREAAAASKLVEGLVVTDAQDSTAKQIADVEDLVARRVKALFIAPREYEGLEPALEAAGRARIPVILIDREAAGRPGVDYLTVIRSDFIEQGRRAGEWLARATHGTARIVELTGTPGSSVAHDRAAGFRIGIAPYPNMTIVGSENADFVRAHALNVMENILQARALRVSAVFAHNDEMALGAIQALRGAGLVPGKDVIVVSIDGERLALEAILRGELGATVESNPRFGPLAFATLGQFLAGEPVPARIVLQDRLFDAENAAKYVAEAY